MPAKQETLQSDQHPGKERDEQDHLGLGVEGNEKHENEERDRGYGHEERRESTAEAEEVGVVGIAGLDPVWKRQYLRRSRGREGGGKPIIWRWSLRGRGTDTKGRA
jgi:hypothetical protein